MFYRVIGPVGSGKRAFLQKMAKEAFEKGKKVYVLVPEQTGADYERELVSLLGPSCSMLVEVTNFTRLSNVVLRSFGELSHRSLGKEEKELILSQVLREEKDNLPHLRLRHDPDSVKGYLREWEELSRAGLDGEGAGRILSDPEVSEDLKAKISEMLLVQARFTEAVAGRYDDPQEEEARLAKILDVYPFFKDSTVIVDAFWDFTVPQERILRRILAQAEDVGISFAAKTSEPVLFQKTLLSARRLLRIAKEVGCDCRDEFLEGETEGEIPFLCRELTRGGEAFEEEPKKIRLFRCRNTREEGRLIASIIRSHLAEGYRPHDFAVLTPSEEGQNLLCLTLEEEGVPVFFERKKPLEESPLARTVLLAAEIASLYPKEETVRNYLLQGLFEEREEDTFLLEKYVSTWSLSGRSLLDGKDFTLNPDGYGDFDKRSREELDRINLEKKRVFTPLRHLSLALAAGKNEEKISAIVAFLVKIGAEERMKKGLDKEKREESEESVRTWNTVLERLSAIARALGEKECEAEDFYHLLRLALSGESGGSIPQEEDRVRLGTVGFSRVDGAKFIFLTNLNAGVFPAPPPHGRLLSDGERESLAEKDFPLIVGERVETEEIFRLYLAAAFAREGLFLSYTTGLGGEEAGTLSVFGKQIQSIFPKMKEESFDSFAIPPYSPESTFRYFLAQKDTPSPLAQKAKAFLEEDEEMKKRLLTTTAAKAEKEVRRNLETVLPYEGKDVNMTFSRFDTYLQCRFSYFVKYLLEAKGEAKGELTSLETGTYVHSILERVFRRVIEKKMDFGTLDNDTLKAWGEEACREAVMEISTGEIPPEVEIQLDRLFLSAFLLLKQLRDEFAVSKFRPFFVEKELEDVGGYSIPLEDGTNLRLFGKIDRVDRYEDESGKVFVRVIDYKTGKKTFSLDDVANGLELQMLIYLFALWGKNLETDPAAKNDDSKKALPAGVLYLAGSKENFSISCRAETAEIDKKTYNGMRRDGLFVDDEGLLNAQDPERKRKFLPVPYAKPRGALDTKGLISMSLLGRMKNKLEADFAAAAMEIRRGKIDVNPLKGAKDACKWCEFLPVCKRRECEKRDYLKKKDLKPEMIYGEED